MKNLIQLSTLALLAASTNIYAHHPAVDMVDPDVYAMIEENISDVHLAMTFDDMGGNSDEVGGAMESRDTESGAEMGSDLADAGAAMESREVMSAMADVEPSGQMGSQR